MLPGKLSSGCSVSNSIRADSLHIVIWNDRQDYARWVVRIMIDRLLRHDHLGAHSN